MFYYSQTKMKKYLSLKYLKFLDMKMLFDYLIFTSQEFGGISRYFYELMN